MFARHPESGEAIWAYQYSPFDQHDYDGINENILADLTINGKLRKVLMHPDRRFWCGMYMRLVTGEKAEGCQSFPPGNAGPNFIAGTPYVGSINRDYAGPGGFRGLYTAYDPVKAKVVWNIKENFPVWSGTLVTATNVAFYGTMDGRARLWCSRKNRGSRKSLRRSSGRSFRGPDGKQYIAVAGGVGGS